MARYTIMKTDGAGDVLPGQIYPFCDVAKWGTTAVLIQAGFKSGNLLNEVLTGGGDAGVVHSKGAVAFINPSPPNGERYVYNGNGVYDLIRYDSWAAQHLTNDTLVQIFEAAWSNYPIGFYWVPMFHPQTLLYKQGSRGKTLRFVRKADGKLYAPVLVQKHAALTSLPPELSIGLTVTGALTSTKLSSVAATIADILRFPTAEKYTPYADIGWTSTASSWDTDQTSLVTSSAAPVSITTILIGTFDSNGVVQYTDPTVGDVSSGLITILPSDLVAFRSKFPADTSTERIAIETLSDVDDVSAHLVDAHGLTTDQVDAFLPSPTASTGAYLPGIYTASTGVRMIVTGAAQNASSGSASDIGDIAADGVTLSNPQIITSGSYASCAPEACYTPAREPLYTFIEHGTSADQVAAVTSPAIPGDTLPNLSGCDCPFHRILAAAIISEDHNLAASITLSTGFADYYIATARIGIRITCENLPAATNPFTVSGSSAIAVDEYDATEGILWLAVDTEAAGLSTTTASEYGKCFEKGQSVTLNITITRDSPTGSNLVKTISEFGSFYGGGTYAEEGTTTNPPSLLSSWNSYSLTGE